MKIQAFILCYESGGGAAKTGETGRRFNDDGRKGDQAGGGARKKK